MDAAGGQGHYVLRFGNTRLARRGAGSAMAGAHAPAAFAEPAPFSDPIVPGGYVTLTTSAASCFCQTKGMT